MSNELLDFSPGGAFFFTENATEEKQLLLKEACEQIRDCAKSVLADFCVLGYRLRKLRANRLWTCVLDENGERYWQDESFYDFTFRFFGFSKTKTQNMISLAEFVKVEDETAVLIDKTYADYKTSQLVELASVSYYERKYFTPQMTIQEMRCLKKYLKYRVIGTCTPEEALSKAKAYEEQEKKNKQHAAQFKQETIVKEFDAETLESFIRYFLRVFPRYDDARKTIYRKTLLKPSMEELAEVLSRECSFGTVYTLTEDKRGHYTADWGSFGLQLNITHPDYEKKVVDLTWLHVARYINSFVLSDQYLTDEEKAAFTEQEDPVEFLSDVLDAYPKKEEETSPVEETPSAAVPDGKRYSLKMREERRFWLKDFKNWNTVEDPRTVCLCAISAYFYALESDDLVVFAYEYQTLPRAGEEIETKVRYLASLGEDGAFVDVSADGIERYLLKHSIEA